MANVTETITDVVIITALDKEREAVLAYVGDYLAKETANRIYYQSKIQARDTILNVKVVPIDSMGNIASAVVVSQVISVWNPRYIILTGIAGGTKAKNRNLGDVLVAEQLTYYEHGKILDGNDERRYQTLPSSFDLLGVAHSISGNDWFKKVRLTPPYGTTRIPEVHFGVFAVGEKVIASETFADSLSTDWAKLIGIEMEGFGAAMAAFRSETRPGFLMVKSICDWADSTKRDTWQKYAAHTAAAFTVNLLTNISESKLSRDRRQAQPMDASLVEYSGKTKICMCQRLNDNWEDLADYFDIPIQDRRRFDKGRECQRIWEWLQEREKLFGLEEALKFISREDLLKCFRAN